MTSYVANITKLKTMNVDMFASSGGTNITPIVSGYVRAEYCVVLVAWGCPRGARILHLMSQYLKAEYYVALILGSANITLIEWIVES